MSDPAAGAVSSRRHHRRRLHPLTPFARGWQVVAVLFVLMANNMLGAGRWQFLLIGLAIVIPVGSLYGYLSWRFTRWWIEGRVLRLETGVLFRRSRQVRLDRLQAIDIVRPLMARFIGLAELRLETAGAGRPRRRSRTCPSTRPARYGRSFWRARPG